MFGIFNSRSRDSDGSNILTNDAEIIENEVFNSTTLKIQNSKGEIHALTRSEERKRAKSHTRLVSKSGQKKIRTLTTVRHRAQKIRDVFTFLVELNWSLHDSIGAQ